jgi:hypothetical protein
LVIWLRRIAASAQISLKIELPKAFVARVSSFRLLSHSLTAARCACAWVNNLTGILPPEGDLL